MDWKEALLRQSQEMGIFLDNISESETNISEPSSEKRPSETLHIAVERKGRGGKTATIIYGFECDDERLREIAAGLKSKLGTGGSAREGEILIQGDRQRDAKIYLSGLGYKIK